MLNKPEGVIQQKKSATRIGVCQQFIVTFLPTLIVLFLLIGIFPSINKTCLTLTY
jgi:hypothetical protein